MKRLFLVICTLAVAVPALAQDASGKWELTATTPQSEPRTTSMVLKKEGDRLSGTVIGPQGTEIALAGKQVGSDVTLEFTVQTQNGPIAISMKGKQDGDTMKGTLLAGTDTQGQWTAARSATAAETSSASASVDLTGTWALQVLTDAGTRTPTVVLKQEGEKLSGRYKSQLGEALVTGKVTGRNFSFEVTLPIEGTPTRITYLGAAGEAGVSGQVTLGGAEVGTFTGKKQESGAK
jgi:hypothetical protein